MDNKKVLITGGSGSFGRAFVEHLFVTFANIKEVIIFSRDEKKHYDMKRIFNPKDYPISYKLGDIRDINRLDEVMSDVDIVIHASALKHVDICEENPFEAIKTNILGSQNIISCAIKNRVQRVVALSTDKSTMPINVYGATKLLLEKLFVSIKSKDTIFNVVRYGNIFGSSGSVVPFFLSKQDNILPITDINMSRFSITIQESISLVIYALNVANCSEIVVPIAPSYNILDVANAINPDASNPIIGRRDGEKLYEIMVTRDESLRTIKRDNYFIITDKICNRDEFEYNSKDNDIWLTKRDIKNLLENL